MYVEMIDETGVVSSAIQEQTLALLNFATEKLGKQDKEMALTKSFAFNRQENRVVSLSIKKLINGVNLVHF